MSPRARAKPEAHDAPAYLVSTYMAPNTSFTRRTHDRKVLRTQIWDAHHPLRVGHPVRWVLHATPEGVVIQNIDRQSKSDERRMFVNHDMIQRGEVSALPHAPSPLWIQISPLKSLHSILAPETATPGVDVESTRAFRLVESVSSSDGGVHWIRSVQPLTPTDETASLRFDGKLLATIQLKHAESPTLRLTSQSDELTWGPKRKTVPRGEGIDLPLDEPAAFSISTQPQWRWTLQSVATSARNTFVDSQKPIGTHITDQIEQEFFTRVVKSTGGVLAAFVLLCFVVPLIFPKNDEELVPEQFAQVVMNQTPSAPAASTPRAAAETAVVQAFQSQAVQNSVSNLLKGGMSKLLAQSDFLGSSRLKGSQSIFKQSDTLQAKTPGATPSDVREVKVATLGGSGNNSYAKGTRASVSGQGGGVVALDLGQIDVEEGLSREEVGKVIHAHMSEIRYCYESAMITNPTLEGKLLVDFSIGAAGSIVRASVKQSTLGDRRVDDCIIRRLQRWAFPKPKGGNKVSVSYPFIFKSVGRQ